MLLSSASERSLLFLDGVDCNCKGTLVGVGDLRLLEESKRAEVSTGGFSSASHDILFSFS